MLGPRFLANEKNYVFKKEHARSPAEQALYKLSKFFSSVRDPTNALKLYDAKWERNTQFTVCKDKTTQNAIVKVSVVVIPLAADSFDQVNHVFVSFAEKPYVAWLLR